MNVFKKTISKFSDEYKILKKIETWKEEEKDMFLPIINEIKIGKNNVCICQKNLPKSVLEQINEKKWNKKKEWNCWKQIITALHILHSHSILHFDVHLGNIMVDGNKFYLIDFGISKMIPIENHSLYHKLCFQWKEDEFQLLWNFVFHNNEYVSDFTTFRKILQQETKKNKSILETEMKLLLPTRNAKEKLKLFLSTEPITLKTVNEKIAFKMFLHRLFLIYHIFIYKPDSFHQKMVHSFHWKK